MDLLCHQQRHTASVLWPEDVDRRLNPRGRGSR